MRRFTKHGTIAATFALATVTNIALAGDGNITPSTATDASQANKISMKLGFTAPLPPIIGNGESLAQLAVRQLQWANRLICDMTDEQFRISDVTFVHGESALENAEVLWFPQNAA